MSLVKTDSLPDSARVWLYGVDPAPGEDVAARLEEEMERFVDGWTAHDEELRAAVDLRAGRFLLIALDESRVSASGCSIDALNRKIRQLQRSHSLEILDGSRIWFASPDGEIRCVGRGEFRRLAAEGTVDPATPVFDLTADRLQEVRSGEWKRPAGESWHARLMPTASPGGNA